MTSDVEYIFIFVICMSSSEKKKRLFKSFAHF